MNQALIKPFATVEGGSRNVYIPRATRTLSIDITSSKNYAPVVGQRQRECARAGYPAVDRGANGAAIGPGFGRPTGGLVQVT
jgi:hypothetical protein